MKNTPIIVGLIAVSGALAGCGHHDAATQPVPSPPLTTQPAIGTNSSPTNTNITPAKTGKAVVYVVDDTHGKDSDNYLVAKTISLRDAREPAREALNALLNADNTPLPVGTALNSVKVADGLATVDFTQSPVDETHGEEAQSQALEAIQRTLGQFPDIQRIQIEVNGRVPASIGEAAGGPLDVIRPGEKRADGA